jgi:hypothetical protein
MSGEWLLILLVPVLHLLVLWRKKRVEDKEHAFWRRWLAERDSR